MRFKNIIEWFDFAIKSPVEELSLALPKDNYAFFHEYSTTFSASDEVLYGLHRKFKGETIEEECWKLILHSYFQPLPEAIALDLIQRNIAIIDLAHSYQVDAILLILASYDDAALLKVGSRYYTKQEYSFEDFECLLNNFRESYQLLKELVYQQPSEENKRKLLERYAAQHLQAEDLLQYIHVLEVEAKARQVSDALQIRELWQTNEPKVWRALADNPHTPVEILEVLTTTSGIKFAKDIRHYAKMNLNKRKKNN